jgi:diaminohydroxyphosphoribosylaminopyrimidine deaminase/5-amino-6-(5-phosphoribosylamino)uracil reductase
LRAGLIDKLLLFVAPKLAGGADAPSLFAGAAAERMADTIGVVRLTSEPVGEDLLVTAYIHEP